MAAVMQAAGWRRGVVWRRPRVQSHNAHIRPAWPDVKNRNHRSPQPQPPIQPASPSGMRACALGAHGTLPRLSSAGGGDSVAEAGAPVGVGTTVLSSDHLSGHSPESGAGALMAVDCGRPAETAPAGSAWPVLWCLTRRWAQGLTWQRRQAAQRGAPGRASVRRCGGSHACGLWRRAWPRGRARLL